MTKKPFLINMFVFAFFLLNVWYHYVLHENLSNLKPKADFNNCFIKFYERERYFVTNNAQFSREWYGNLQLTTKAQDGFHLVTYFALLSNSFYVNNLRYKLNDKPTKVQLDERQQEIEDCLQNNLNNNLIVNVHVLIYHVEIAQYLLNLPLSNSSKLVLHLTRMDPTVRSSFDYAERYLFDKTIIVMHMDIYLGPGWYNIIQHLQKSSIMYALTRHSISNNESCDATNYGTCNVDSSYIGSHDAFAFHMKKDFSNDMLYDLGQFKSINEGSENVLIWHFINSMNYTVLNPCRTLVIYHKHCIPIRTIERKRVDRNLGKTGRAPFTEKLY
ncbi:uncharacterized protein LOC105848843 [Hydra vulgaris]|uniref:uncharacterized protein LOC105848843 n=1 Tax=Hydra vulgaris TaxID=6087 RepID=UPI0006410622|nr:uncharacterized protein LOC105848843 [Hydra vulgaris]